ncbi:hypothetical protein [Treponema sp. R6D11]
MSITQTVEIPANHRLTIDVPKEVPSGRTIIAFTPAPAEDELNSEGECPICAAHDYMPNAETIAAIEEGRAMMRGEIPSKLYNSLEEMLKDLDSDD